MRMFNALLHLKAKEIKLLTYICTMDFSLKELTRIRKLANNIIMISYLRLLKYKPWCYPEGLLIEQNTSAIATGFPLREQAMVTADKPSTLIWVKVWCLKGTSNG